MTTDAPSIGSRQNRKGGYLPLRIASPPPCVVSVCFDCRAWNAAFLMAGCGVHRLRYKRRLRVCRRIALDWVLRYGDFAQAAQLESGSPIGSKSLYLTTVTSHMYLASVESMSIAQATICMLWAVLQGAQPAPWLAQGRGGRVFRLCFSPACRRSTCAQTPHLRRRRLPSSAGMRATGRSATNRASHSQAPSRSVATRGRSLSAAWSTGVDPMDTEDAEARSTHGCARHDTRHTMPHSKKVHVRRAEGKAREHLSREDAPPAKKGRNRRRGPRTSRRRRS